ncbi:MAG: hypothetical protein KDB27_30490 [Planctomycetales bacterium]|nr:hypothetical protein [Planctomycetales bacterium]
MDICEQFSIDKLVGRVISLCVTWSIAASAHAEFKIDVTIESPGAFTSSRRALLDENLQRATRLWESVILGYDELDGDVSFPLTVVPTHTGLAAAQTDTIRVINDTFIATSGTMFVNVDEIENIVTGVGVAPGVNTFDELLAHEIGHALGFGTQWVNNDLYENGTGRYVGQYGLDAYRAEFDAAAEFVPVELAGTGGSADAHWDQLFRSSPQEGNPADPYSLNPLVGITDARGRDLAQDIMSPALDADFGEPFLSNTTVQAMRDIGFDVVASFPFVGDIDGNGFIEITDVDALAKLIAVRSANVIYDLDNDGTVSSSDRETLVRDILGTDYGDANLDGLFNSSDLVLVSQAAEYRDDIEGNSTWRTGDWDGDLEFDSGDLLIAFKTGRYEQGQALLVPEPNFAVALAFISIARFHRLRQRDSV